VGLTPRLRYYRYLKGHSFGCHVDQSIKGDSSDQRECELFIAQNLCEHGSSDNVTTDRSTNANACKLN